MNCPEQPAATNVQEQLGCPQPRTYRIKIRCAKSLFFADGVPYMFLFLVLQGTITVVEGERPWKWVLGAFWEWILPYYVLAAVRK